MLCNVGEWCWILIPIFALRALYNKMSSLYTQYKVWFHSRVKPDLPFREWRGWQACAMTSFLTNGCLSEQRSPDVISGCNVAYPGSAPGLSGAMLRGTIWNRYKQGARHVSLSLRQVVTRFWAGLAVVRCCPPRTARRMKIMVYNEVLIFEGLVPSL